MIEKAFLFRALIYISLAREWSQFEMSELSSVFTSLSNTQCFYSLFVYITHSFAKYYKYLLHA